MEGNELDRIHGSGFLRLECLSLVDLSISVALDVSFRMSYRSLNTDSMHKRK